MNECMHCCPPSGLLHQHLFRSSIQIATNCTISSFLVTTALYFTVFMWHNSFIFLPVIKHLDHQVLQWTEVLFSLVVVMICYSLINDEEHFSYAYWLLICPLFSSCNICFHFSEKCEHCKSNTKMIFTLTRLFSRIKSLGLVYLPLPITQESPLGYFESLPHLFLLMLSERASK